MVRRSSSQLTETVGLLEGDLLGVVVGIAVVGDTEGDFEGDWLGPEVGRDVTSKTDDPGGSGSVTASHPRTRHPARRTKPM